MVTYRPSDVRGSLDPRFLFFQGPLLPSARATSTRLTLFPLFASFLATPVQDDERTTEDPTRVPINLRPPIFVSSFGRDKDDPSFRADRDCTRSRDRPFDYRSVPIGNAYPTFRSLRGTFRALICLAVRIS